jgi:transposase
MIEVAQYYLIKQLYEREGLSQREIAKRLKISRNTVRAYLQSGQVPTTVTRKESYGKRVLSPETQRVLPMIDQWLEDDRSVWKKQRHTAVRIYHRLVVEYQFRGAESTIRRVVRERRKQLQEVFIPLVFQLGQHFQFDWGEADVVLQGEDRRIYLFCIQLSASRKKFVHAYLHEKQEAFLDGFVQAFTYFGGVPARGLFDNLKSAVIKVLEGRERLEQETFQALQAHYLFKAEFCNIRKGNEKGQVEGLVGYVRRNALVPIPHIQTLDELNAHLLAWCETSASHDTVPHTQRTIEDVWKEEQATLHPLPEQPFEPCRLSEVEVSKLSVITFETNRYSVPSRYVGSCVWVKGFVDHVIIVAQNQVIARHFRSYERGQMLLQLDHYLEALLQKPRAARDARVMQTPQVPDSLRQLQAQMNQRHGADGDRGFVRFLLLHRELGMEVLAKAAEMAEVAGVYRYEGLHEMVLHLTGQRPLTHAMPESKIPVDLHSYRIQKVNVQQFSALLGGVQE